MQWLEPLLLGHFLLSSSTSGLVGSMGRPDAVLTEQELWEEVILTPTMAHGPFSSHAHQVSLISNAAQILFAETHTRVSVSVGP